MYTDERIFQVALSLLPGIGPATAKKLIETCGTAAAVFRQKKNRLIAIPQYGDAIAEALKGDAVLHAAAKEIEFAEQKGIRVLTCLDEAYPHRLKQCPDRPVVLFLDGNARLNGKRYVGIVGTRRVSPYGEMLTEQLVESLAGQGITIVSGLAYGVDIVAHKAALKHGLPTIGVLAHGLDTLYPSAHRTVARKMVEAGGLLSDFPSGTKPDKENFPKRNRIVAGICDAVVVVESGESGGSMITAEYANNYNREVFAFPGRIGDELSAGCHKLIKTHKAALIESGDDLLRYMGWGEAVKKTAGQKSLAIPADPNEEKIVMLLRSEGSLHADEIATGTGLPDGKAAALLLKLEFDGLVKALPGKFFRLA
jgi:DNA processing protein